MPREILLAVAAGLAGGVLYTALLAGSVGGIMFAYLSQVPLFLVGLGLGLLPALIAGGVATLLVAVAGDALAALLFVLTSVGPLVVLVRQALLNRPTGAGSTEWYPPGLLVAWMAGIAAVGIVLSGFLLLDHPEGYEGAVRAMLQTAMGGMAPAGVSPESVEHFAGQLAGMFPGLVAVSWMLMMAVNGSLAQGLLVGLGRNLRPSPSMALIELPAWLLYAFGLAALVAVAVDGSVGYIARNLAIALTVPFFFQGLAVVHALANRWAARTLALFMFYLVLVVLGWPAILVTAIGLAEPFLRLRVRYGRPTAPEEE